MVFGELVVVVVELIGDFGEGEGGGDGFGVCLFGVDWDEVEDGEGDVIYFEG